MSLWTAICLLFALSDGRAQECVGRADVGFVLDGSGSVSLANWRQMLNFVKEFAGRVWYGLKEIRIGVITYGDEARLDIALSQYASVEDFNEAVDSLHYLSQGTNTAAGIRALSEQLFTTKYGNRADVINIGFVVTDGESNVNREQTLAEATTAREQGIILFALGIGDNLNQQELNAIGNDPDNEYVFNVGDFQSLLSDVDRIANSTCKVINTLGPRCYFDIAFILDASGSIGHANWKKVKEFAINFVSRLPIGLNHSQVGVVSFSTHAKMAIPLNRYHSARTLQSAIARLEWKDHQTHTAAAFAKVHHELFTVANGDRLDAYNVVVVITDGKTNVNRSQTAVEAKSLRDLKKARIFSTIIGDDVRMSELRGISSEPDYFYSTILENYDQLVGKSSEMRDKVCLDAKPVGLPDYKACRADIAFVLDESGSVGRENWDTMLRFVAQFASLIAIGPGANAVGVVKFSSSSKLAIRLNQYNNSLDFSRAVKELTYKMGGTNTAAGLLTTRERLFSLANGDRPDAGNIAIVVTDGASNSRQRTITEANKAREAGITIFAIGIGDALAWSELQDIANDPDSDYLLFSTNFESLVNYTGQILRSACFAAGSTWPLWSCDFEANNTTASWCGIQQIKDDQFDWSMHSGPTLSKRTGPPSASDGKNYIYIEASYPRQLGDSAELILPYLAGEEGVHCLTFWRHMFGFHIGVLQVYVVKTNFDKTTVWNMKKEQGDIWILQHVPIYLSIGEQVGVRGICRNGHAGDIALDGMKLIKGDCPQSFS